MIGRARADWLIVPILLAAAALRLGSAGYSLWFDEIAAVRFAEQPLELLWSGWMAREANPPLYYTLLKGWIALFGSSDLAVRALSVLIGIMGIGAAWWLARRIGGRGAGLAAAALLAVSTAHLDYSQEVRGYILAHSAALFGCIAMVAYLDRPRIAPLAGYVVAALVALYAHTTMVVFVALANAAMLWLLRGDRRALVRWLAANLIVGLLWSWWAWISLGQAGASSSTFGWIARPGVAQALEMTGVVYLPFYIAGEKVAMLPVLALAWLGGWAWFAVRERRPAVVLLAVLALGAPLLLWGLSQKLPIFLPRTLFWAAGPMAVLVALVRMRSVPVHTALLGLLLLLELGATLRWLPMRETEAWPQAIAAADAADPDAVLLVEGDAMGVAARHYLAQRGSRLRLMVLTPEVASDRWANGLAGAPHVDAAGARALLARERRVFVLIRGDYDPGRVLAPGGVAQPFYGTTGKRQPGLSLWRAHQPSPFVSSVVEKR
ncbi:glycosyltransferase family 39 protein [Sphingomonas sp. HF-S4]|uniref:Glycosyltransferase family 39 protein n=1 Tax=Sphingomonas agrestis TaxID=3080540 RepID=A0ABU3Y8T4_9SPHN|nr:glycosyltransferase family 39 protein [Sphingomonas sp. HF-S4]MDV3457810.1 glycosyltransferase family 39 protein [Sphingomonas sp. HF-S4]